MINFFKRIFSIFLSLIIIFPQFFTFIKASDDVTIDVNLFNKLDVAFSVGQTGVDYSNFEQDLRAKLSNKSPKVREEDLYVTAGQNVDSATSNSFSWWTYDHGTSSNLNDGTHTYMENVNVAKSQSSNPTNTYESHIQTSNNGSTMDFYGYGSSGYKDFQYLPDDQATKKTFEFSIQELEAYDALDGCGFFFNTSVSTDNYGSQTMSGYLLFLQYNSSGKGESMNIYKFSNINTKSFHNTASANIASYSGFTKIASTSYSSTDTYRKFKVEVQPTKLTMLYKGSTSSLDSYTLNEISDLVTWTPTSGSTTTTITYDLPISYGYGPMCGYRSHNCERVTHMKLYNLSMTAEKVRSLTEVVRQPSWHENTIKFIVNLNEYPIDDFENSSTVAELLNRFTNEDIYYIGWCGSNNLSQTQTLLQKNDSKGVAVNINSSSTSTYNTQIQIIADEIYSHYQVPSSNQYILTTNEVVFNINGDTGTETNMMYPEGKWKIIHTIENIDNGEGIHELSNKYITSLDEFKFNKPGTYKIYWCDTLMKTLIAHRKPIANFNFTINGSSVTFNDTSQDLDGNNLTSSWKYKDLNSSSASLIDGQPSTLNASSVYLVQLTVTDSYGASSTIAKQVSKNTVSSIPYADFEISPTIIYKGVGNQKINLVNKSYDSNGKNITSKFALKNNSGSTINYTFKAGDNDISSLSVGTYSIELIVNNGSVNSVPVYKSFSIAQDTTKPTVTATSTSGNFISDTTISLMFTDSGGSGFKNQRTCIKNSTSTPAESEWSNKSYATSKNIDITESGTSYIHYEAWDNAENKKYGYFGPYTLSKKDAILDFIVSPNQVTQPEKITFILNLTPYDENASIPTGYVLFKIGERNVDQVEVKNGLACLTHEPEIYGTYDLTAVYSGDNKYNSATKTVNNYVIKRNPTQEAIVIENLDDTYVYGHPDFPLKISGGSGNGALTFNSTDTSVARIDNSGNIKIVGVGKFQIIITKDGDEDFNPTTVSSKSVIVNKKPVTITGVSSKNKVYDGTTNAEIQGTPIINSILDGDIVEVKTGIGVFNDKNVGTSKTVAFSNFELIGKDAEKYILMNQPTSVSDLEITKKDLTLDFKILDKAYDGLNIAKYEKEPILVGVATGDNIILNKGTPTFDDIQIGRHNINFTNFSISGSDVNNYNLIQPTNITANINNGFTPIENTHYTLSNPDTNEGWYVGRNFVIEATPGYYISLENSDDSNWQSQLVFQDETPNRDIKFYLRNANTKEISVSKIESYKKDNTAPTGEIKINDNSYTQFLNTLTFGLFFKKTKDVQIIANDSISGISKIEYIKSETLFENENDIKNSDKWKNDKALSDNSIILNASPNEKFYVYAKIFDNAGNYSIINSEGIVIYTDSEQMDRSIHFTKTSTTDVIAMVKLNGNTVNKILNEEYELQPSDYTIENDNIIFKATYLDTLLAGNYIFTISYNPMGENFVNSPENQIPNNTTISLIVSKAEQNSNFNFESVSDEYVYGQGTINLHTVGGSGTGEVIYTSDNSNVATIGNTSFNILSQGDFVLTATKSADDNYNSISISKRIKINKRNVSILGISAKNKIYDGNKDIDYIVDDTTQISNKIEGDDLEIDYTDAKANFTNASAEINKPVIFSGFKLKGTAASNYNLIAQPDSSLATITKLGVTINNVKVSDKIYDGITVATITDIGELSNKIVDDDVSIKKGSANFYNKNVGNNKSVIFNDFSLIGAHATNYNLLQQPSDVTANITPLDLNINLLINNKKYDGLDTAKYKIFPELSGNLSNDDIILQQDSGNPKFSNINIGKNILINFEPFIIVGDDILNYNLIQPSNITADIEDGFVALKDTHYNISNPATNGGIDGWYNNEFIINVSDPNHKVSLNNTNDGPWTNFLRFEDETSVEGKSIEFYVRDINTKEISTVAHENYKLDNHLPTAEIIVGTNVFNKFLNIISFGIFFKDTVNVSIIAKDDLSGIQSIEYIKTDSEITETDITTQDSWTLGDNFNVSPDEKFIVYAKVVDKAGNIIYINTDGVITFVQPIKIEADTNFEQNVWQNNKDSKIDVNISHQLPVIKQVSYIINDSSPIDVTVKDKTNVAFDIPVLPNGDYNVVIKAIDELSQEYTKTVHVKKDTIAPKFYSVDFNSEYINRDVKLEINAYDDFIDVNELKYSFDSGRTWGDKNITYYSNNEKIEADTLQIKDKAGNIITYEEPILINFIDKLIPLKPTILGALKGWQNENITLTVVAEDIEANSDNAQSGIDFFEYSTDGGSTFTKVNWDESHQFTITENGDYTDKIVVRVTDKAGNISELSDKYTVKLNKENPIIDDVKLNNYEWTNQNIKVTVIAHDDLSGLSEQAYSFDDGQTWQEKNEKLFDKNCIVKVKVRNLSGNISSYEDIAIKNIDKLPPQKPIIEDASTEWKNQDITLTVVAEDIEEATDNAQSGIDFFEYSVDGGNTFTQINWGESHRFTITENGDYTDKIVAKITDKAGNISELSEKYTVKLNKENPIIDDVKLNNYEWTNQNIKVTVIAHDDVSGLSGQAYSFDDGQTWQEENEKLFDKNCIVKVKVRNLSGNISSYEDIVIKNIDKLPPQKPIIEGASDDWKNEDITLKVISSDKESDSNNAKSEISFFEYSIDGGNTFKKEKWNNSNEFKITTNGDYTGKIVVKVTDKAGNTSDLSNFYSAKLNKEVVLYPFKQIDKNTSIIMEAPNGVFPENSKLVIKTIDNEKSDEYQKAIDLLGNEIRKNLKNLKLYEVYIIDKDENYLQPNTQYGLVNTKIPIPEDFNKKNLSLYRLISGSENQKFDFNIIDIDNKSYCEFQTDHFSLYALVELKSDNFNWYLFVAIILIISLSIFLIYKYYYCKRKN